MEKAAPGPRDRLIDAGLAILADAGAAACTVRAVEAAAGLPHGSIRHHFTDRAGYLRALVDALLAADLVEEGDTPPAYLHRALTTERSRTIARYELFLIALRDPDLRARVVTSRDHLVRTATANGIRPDRAPLAVALLDGVILDALLRDAPPADPMPALTALLATPPEPQPPASTPPT